MLIFGMDTCCMPATAAVLSDGRLAAEFVLCCGKTHSQKIMPQIDNMFKELGIKPSDIDCFAAACGPGSFTGVRIGTAALKAIAHAACKPCAAVSTLEALAQNVPYFGGIICPILDARRGQVYTASFESDADGGVRRLTADSAELLDDVLTQLKETGRDVLFLGDGIFVHRADIESKLGAPAHFAPPNLNLNMAGSVALLGAKAFKSGKTVSCAELVPSYIRLSQAERERLEKENGKNKGEA